MSLNKTQSYVTLALFLGKRRQKHKTPIKAYLSRNKTKKQAQNAVPRTHPLPFPLGEHNQKPKTRASPSFEENKTKRNNTKRNKTKRNETKRETNAHQLPSGVVTSTPVLLLVEMGLHARKPQAPVHIGLYVRGAKNPKKEVKAQFLKRGHGKRQEKASRLFLPKIYA